MRTRTRGGVIRVLVITLTLVATVALLRRVPEPEKSPTSAMPTASTSLPASGSPTGTAPPTREATPSPSPENWQRTAQTFVTAYGTTTGGQKAWLARLQPLVSADVYSGFTQTDLANLPGGTPGAGRVVVSDEYSGGTMRVPLTGGAVWGVDVTVAVAADGREVVTRVAPVESAGAQP